MKGYYRIFLGRHGIYADVCFQQGFIGADFGIDQDLTGRLPEEWRVFNQVFIPIYQTIHPGKSKVAAGLACGSLWTVAKGVFVGDLVLSPDGTGGYRAGEVAGGYYYSPGDILPHRRQITWYSGSIQRSEMSTELQNSTGSIGTVCNITRHAVEIDRLASGKPDTSLTCNDETVENPSIFALEKHLEDFLVKNWGQTLLSQQYDIYQVDGDLVGQQYPSDTGPIDILAISKDRTVLLVVELKRGRASDVVVGQIQRYMGYVQEVLAENSQQVKGVIIALEDDLKLRRALAVAPNIEFYRYQVNFKLLKG
jgi:restriction system protein